MTTLERVDEPSAIATPTAADARQAAADGTQAAAGPPARPSGPVRPMTVPEAIGLGLTLLATLVLGFAAYLYYLSGVQEHRAQTTLYATLRGELANAVAPVGNNPLPRPGAPVAVLDIPRIHLRHVVVVQGTTSEDLALGPGHLSSGPLPGQAGVSAIYGRRATFGAPFARLPELRQGDTIRVTTGQGVSVYTVRQTIDSKHQYPIDPAPNQLVLLTSDSRAIPSHFSEVQADMTAAPQPDPALRPAVNPAEAALSRDDGALVFTMLWGLALFLVSLGGVIAAARWSKWPAYMATVPVVIAIVWNLYQNLAALLPNLY
jgi:sortase A